MDDINNKIILDYLNVFYPVNRIKNKGNFKRGIVINGKPYFLTNLKSDKSIVYILIDDVCKAFYLSKNDSTKIISYFLNIKL